MRSPVIHVEIPRTSTNIDTEGAPREWLLEDALAKVAGEEKTVRLIASECCEKP